MITVALTKGRLYKDFIRFLEARGATDYMEELKQDNRSLFTVINNIRFIFAKGKDVPVYVETGVADLGIVGQDILLETPANVLNVSKLPFGNCRMTVLASSQLIHNGHSSHQDLSVIVSARRLTSQMLSNM